jgi:exopolysaccharide production protein ExoZ
MTTLLSPEIKQCVAVPSAVRLDALDLLRGLCAVAVAMYHYHMWSGAVVPRFVESLLAIAGTYGVSVFFILSGYSLAHAYHNKFQTKISVDDYQKYIRRRIGRLAPLFLFAIILSIIGKIVISHKLLDFYAIAANVFLLFGFVQPSNSPVIGGWSIGIEVVYYIIFPLLIIMAASRSITLICTAFFTAWITLKVSDFGDLYLGWSWYVHPANHLIFFAIGVYARLGNQFMLGRSLLFDRALAIGCVCGIVICASTGLTEFEAVTGVMRFVLVILSSMLVLSMGQLKFHGPLRAASAVLGGMSYPLYLFHPLVYFAFFGFAGGIEDGISWLPALFVVAMLGAVIADRFVDRPLQRRLKAAGW